MTQQNDNYNPYAAPIAPLVEPDYAGARIRIEGKALVVARHNSALPNICIRTGKAISRREVDTKVTLYYMSPWFYLLLLLNVLILIIVSLIVRKTGDLQIGISAEAKSQRNKAILMAWGMFLAPLFLLFFVEQLGVPALYWLAPIGFIAAITTYFLKIRLVWAEKIDDKNMWVRGIPMEVMQRMVAASSR